jgi:hypothetical protein
MNLARFGPSRGAAAGAVALFALTFAAWHPALRTQMVSDDFALVGRIDFARAFDHFHESFGFGRNEYRPLTALSFAVDNWLWSDRAAGYHFTNIVLHGATAALLFLCLHALTADIALAVISALVFTIHPANHSRVVWISARDGPVCAVFLLTAMWLHIRARRNGRSGDWRGVLAAGFALLSYEAAVVLPILLLGVEVLFFPTGSPTSCVRNALRRTLPFWILLGAYIGLWHVLFSDGITGYDLRTHPTAVLENYARLLYTLFYGHRRLAFGIAYLLLIVLCAPLIMRQRRLLIMAGILVIVGFLPFTAIHGFAHRFAYFSAMGFALLVGLCLTSVIRSAGTPAARLTVAALGVVLCGFYAVEIRKIQGEWKVAGDLAARIPQAVRRLYPEPEEGMLLIFRNVPRMYGRAMVYPTGLGLAVQREFPVKVHVRQNGAAAAARNAFPPEKVHIFNFVGGQQVLTEVATSR